MIKENKKIHVKADTILKKGFDKYYESRKEFEKDIIDNVNIALKELEEGKGIPMKQILKEMEEEDNIKLQV